MKKSLMLISFAFIFLLSVSVVSANFFDWITGDVQRKTSNIKGDTPTGISSEGDSSSSTIFSRPSTLTRTPSPTSAGEGGPKTCSPPCNEFEECSPELGICSKVRSVSSGADSSSSRLGKAAGSLGSSARFGSAGACPRGWLTLLAKDGGNCCRKAENKGRTGLFVR